jgi:Carboxypeptidase regulatory-like domain
MLNFNTRTAGRRRGLLIRAIFCASLLCSTILAQSTSGTAGIRGMVIDQNGEPVVGAKVSITSKATEAVLHTTTSSVGVYSSGPLQPGDYVVRVEVKGFKRGERAVITRVAVISGANFRLQPGAETEVVNEEALGATTVNTEQPTVQSILLPSQMDLLPVSGRSVFDFAQFAPSVQLQDGSVLYPGKDGFSSISFASHYGRAARVEVDGVSISDETFGATAQNIAPSAIQEFNLSQSSLDLPSEMSSTGTVNIATRSGSNALHAEAFGIFRGHQGSAALPGGGPQTFQREQYGASAGGVLVKDKIFWFLAGERTQQNLTAAENFAPPFNAVGETVSLPFRGVQADGRLDWQRRDDARGFYRFTFDQVSQIYPFGPATSFQGLRTATHTPSHTLGYDFTRGAYTHSIRFEYLRLRNGIGDDTATLSNAENPLPGLGINLGAAVNGNCSQSSGGTYCAGPSPFAGQANLQSNLNFRYDGTRLMGSHVIRFGVAYNYVRAGGFAALYANPQVGANSVCLPGSNVIDCLTSTNPTAYPADFVTLGNGLNFSTAKSAFGYSGGGLGPDNQIEAYIGDGWRIKPNLTLTYGLRYVRDTGRVDSNLGPLAALNQWVPGLSNSVRNPNTNFAPQFGFAWNVEGTGKTVIRGGFGIYYDSSLFSNAWADSRARNAKGAFAYTPQVCSFGNPAPFFWPTSLAGLAVNSPIAGGTAVVTNSATNQVAPTFCGSTISAASSQILALNSAFQAATAANGASQANPNYVPTALSAVNVNGVDVFNSDYRTPRSVQMNLGFQHEVRPGTVFSVDYVRNISTHTLLIEDMNHSGAARSYNFLNAIAARNAVEIPLGCTVNGTGALGEAQCVVNKLGSVAAAQAAFSAAGLDSNSATAGGGPCSFCAFPGITPTGINRTGLGGGNGTLGTLDMLSAAGRSVYSGWQGKLMQRLTNPFVGVKTANIQVAYTYSKFISQDQDQDFPAVATNNDLPQQFTGPNGLDRKHQISLAGTFDLPLGLKFNLVTHLYSPLAQTLRMPELTNGGEIFASDWLGSGLGSGAPPEPVQGTGIGQFMRGTNISNLQNVISNYNTNFAGTLTPAGHCLVADTSCPGTAPIAVMTTNDLAALGWVKPTLPSVPQGAADSPWLKTVDLRLAWPIKIRDRFNIEPSASVFNAFNFANAFLPGNLPNGSMLAGPNPTFVSNGVLAPSVAGGVTKAGLTPFRNSLQSGTFALGAPRQLEFGLRISF